ncbi:VirB4 family type IV secretion system protein [Brevibacillus dissolubilis]|uniref:VirB4 family type IV secretion system protein n=1 Tax=Brevibacillus dissolubilis TaxID=1844116 RepID=UPI00159BB9F6|nr:DUF87 domain-containing protein [Brevibacillus dissolubilis]
MFRRKDRIAITKERASTNVNQTVDRDRNTKTVYSRKEAILLSPTVLRERNEIDYWIELGNNTDGATYLRAWFAKLTGRTTWVGMLERILLHGGDGQVDVTICVEPKDASLEMQRMAHRIAVLEADLRTTQNAAEVGDKMQELGDLQGRMSRLRVDQEKLFQTAIIMTVAANQPERMQKISRLLIKSMAGIGIHFRSADTRQLAALRHAIGVGRRMEFDDIYREMESSNVADSFLFGYGGLSHRTGVLLGLDQYNRPVFYDGWDAALANQHMIVLGRSGSGKSFTLKVIIRRSGAIGIHTAIIELDREYKELVEAMGGVYVELSPKAPNYQRINIYDVEEEEDEKGRVFVNLEESIQAVQAVLFKMIRLIDEKELTGQVKVAILESLRDLYERFGITDDPSSLYEPNEHGVWVKRQMPTLYDHYLLMVQHPDLQRVAPFIRLFTRDNGDPIRAIFDGPSTFSIQDARTIGITVADLDEEWMKPLGTFVATKWLWEKFAKKNREQRKRLIIEEAQHEMEDSEQAKWLENGYRRARKLNVSMCVATQGFEVFMRVPEGMGILKNSPTKLLLRQEAIDIDAVQGKFDLSEGEANFLLRAPRGVGILKVDEESTIVRMLATPREYWMYTTDPNDREASA